MIELFDSHAHVDGPEFETDRAQVLARARAEGITRIVVIGAVGDTTSAQRAVALAQTDSKVWATVATHPHDVAKMTAEWWQTHEQLARHERVVAIGETGLDYYYEHSPRAEQQTAFERFLDLAQRVGKPVVCHIRDAHSDAQAILKRHPHALELGCIIHCFTGTPDDARTYGELDCYVSFSGIATYKTAQPVRDAIAVVPRDRLLIETDCPYLAPIPKRGKRNEPGFLTYTAHQVATSAGMSFEELAAATTRNACRVYKVD